MSLPFTSRALPPELADLDGALKSLLATSPQPWDDNTVSDAMVAVIGLGAKLDAVATDLAAVWGARRLWADDGSRSPKARLGRDTSENPARLGPILKRANRLRSMPLVQEAWRSGEIGTDRVDVLCRANTPHRADAFAKDETLLVWMATAFEDFETFSRQVRRWCDAADEAGSDPDPESRARKQKDARHMNLGEGLDGVKFFSGRLDAVDGEIFDRELQRLERKLFDADWAAIRAEHGDAATVLHLPRTATQRRADALRIMAERSATCSDSARPPRPLITVVVDNDSLMGPIRELFNRTILTPGQVAGLLSEADIERAVFAGPSRVLDLGARSRLFTGATRRAIEIRDRQCTFPGCDVDVEWCQVDHIVEWSDGGLTIQDNGRLLCPTHNRQRPGRRDNSTTESSPEVDDRSRPDDADDLDASDDLHLMDDRPEPDGPDDHDGHGPDDLHLMDDQLEPNGPDRLDDLDEVDEVDEVGAPYGQNVSDLTEPSARGESADDDGRWADAADRPGQAAKDAAAARGGQTCPTCGSMLRDAPGPEDVPSP